MKENVFLIGSTSFFKDIEGFKSKDVDHLIIEDEPSRNYKICLQITGKGKCKFYWKKGTADEFVEWTLKFKLPMLVGKFLVPEVVKYIGFDIDHLKKLQPMIDTLDDRHKYEKVIYDAYIENNDFTLTNEQLMNAYEEYKKYRK